MTAANNELASKRRDGVEAALRRAAEEAKRIAEQTKTPLFVLRNGVIVDLCQEKQNAK